MFFHKHEISDLIHVIIHMEKTVRAMPCQKDWKLLENKKKESQDLCKSSTKQMLVPSQRYQHFKHILQNPKLKLTTSLSKNNYWTYSLGPYKTIPSWDKVGIEFTGSQFYPNFAIPSPNQPPLAFLLTYQLILTKIVFMKYLFWR